MQTANVVAGAESLCMFVLSIFSLILFGSIFYLHIVSKEYKNKAPSCFVTIYIHNVLVFGVLLIVHAVYLMAFWRPENNIYNASWIYYTGVFPAVAISSIQIAIFFLGIERILCIIFPVDKTEMIQYFLLSLFIFCDIIVLILLFTVFMRTPPKQGKTDCFSVYCMADKTVSLVYMILRIIFSFLNTVFGVVIWVCVKRKIKNGGAGPKKGLTTRLAINTFFSSFLFDFVPHFTVVILAVTTNLPVKLIGPFSLFFGALDVALCAILYHISFANLRQMMDRKKIAMVTFDAIGVRMPTSSSNQENTRF